MNFFDHKNLGNHLLQLCPKVVKHPVYKPSNVTVNYATEGKKTDKWLELASSSTQVCQTVFKHFQVLRKVGVKFGHLFFPTSGNEKKKKRLHT